MIKIELENENANVYTPFNPNFVQKIKGIGGAKWNATQKCWSIPASSVDVARQIMIDVYGYSDISANETVTVKAIFNEEIIKTCADVVLFGKVLSHAYGRDSGARVGDDVAFSSGMPTSGGSVKNWASVVPKGSVVVLTNVNKNVYNKEINNLPKEVTVEVIDKSKIDRSELLAEKEALLKRLKEIDKLLAQY